MRRFVGGVEATFDPLAASVTSLPDRLVVRGPDGAHSALALRSGDKVFVSYRGHVYTVESSLPRSKTVGPAGSGEMRAPMPGMIVDVLKTEGDSVKKGEKVLVLEAMKTQQPFLAPFDGKVAKLEAKQGVQVAEGALLAIIEPGEAA